MSDFSENLSVLPNTNTAVPYTNSDVYNDELNAVIELASRMDAMDVDGMDADATAAMEATETEGTEPLVNEASLLDAESVEAEPVMENVTAPTEVPAEAEPAATALESVPETVNPLTQVGADINSAVPMAMVVSAPVDVVLPTGFQVNGDWIEVKIKIKGKGKKDEDIEETHRVCHRIAVTAQTQTLEGDWGIKVTFKDRVGVEKTVFVSDAELHGNVQALVQRFARQGLRFAHKMNGFFQKLLNEWEVSKRILIVHRLGWTDDPDGRMVFVLPDRVIAKEELRSTIEFQPTAGLSNLPKVRAQGILEEWKFHVAAPACQQPMMLFALSMGFAPMLLAYVNAMDSFIVHLFGMTSTSKTTQMQVGASVWGCGADPAYSPGQSYLQTWHQTANGLEGQAAAHHDLLLALDELGSTDIDDVGRVIYMVSGGLGKGTQKSNRALNTQTAWRTMVFSTGEISLHEKMTDPGSHGSRHRAVKAGLTHRGLDIHVDGVAADLSDDERRAWINGLKTGCAQYFGTAGPALVQAITDRFGHADEFRAWLNKEIEHVRSYFIPTGTVSEPIMRALQRFALISVAGETAAHCKIIPTSAEKVRAAVKEVADRWLAARAQTDEERIVTLVRAFLFRNRGKFQKHDDSNVLTSRAGWYKSDEDQWIFLDGTLASAAPGHPLDAIVKALNEKGLLFKNNSGSPRAKHTIKALGGDANSKGKRNRFYTVKGCILGNDEEDEATTTTSDSTDGQDTRDNRDIVA